MVDLSAHILWGAKSPIGGLALPPGVTLRDIDGGPTFYADSGLTYAVDMGWDDPGFFPIGPWFSTYDDGIISGTYATWADLGWNVAWHYDNLNQTQALARGVSYMYADDGVAITGSHNAALVGLMGRDEPDLYADVRDPVEDTANSLQDGRFWYNNYTWNWMVPADHWEEVFIGAPGGATNKSITVATFSTPNATVRRGTHLLSADVYWFTAAREPEWPYMLGTNGGGRIYRLPSGIMTTTEMQRGSNYGDMIDINRAYSSASPIPIIGFIENGDPWEDTPAVPGATGGAESMYIQPPEFHWAIWSMIIHGVRGLNIFDHTFQGGGAANRNFAENPGNWYKSLYTGQSISIYDQAKADFQLIHGLARIINSPFALGYCTVSPAGYLFPTPGGGFDGDGYALVQLASGNAIELCVHYYTGGEYTNSYGTFGNGFYIFATTRYNASATSISATFTIPNTGATTVTVVNESRTINITNGGTQFTDTFATAYTVHIYKVG